MASQPALVMNLQLQPAWSNLGGKSVVPSRRLTEPARPRLGVDLYTGGAHCVLLTMIYTLGAQGLARRIQQSWGSAGYRLVDIDGDGTFEFQSANDGFAHAFTDYADSVDPIQIWGSTGRKARRHDEELPGTIAADAKTLMKLYLRQRAERDVRGVLAAYVADSRFSALRIRDGRSLTPRWREVTSTKGYGGAHGSQYIANLRKFLARKWVWLT